MDEKSEGGRENGGGNGTNDTKVKEEETTLAADSGDTENGVAQNVADGIKTEGPEAVPEAETTPEEPSGTVPSKSGSAQPTAEPESQEDTRGMKTKADEEVKEPYDEAQNATEDKNIAQGKTDQTNASNSEKQPNLDCSQAAPGTDQVETSRAVQYQDGGPTQPAADSPSELAGNKGIKEPNDKNPDAPTAQSIKRNNMEDSSSNGTQKPLPGSGGISDSNLKKLTKALMVDDYSARSLGRTLGFIPTEVYRYCGYGKPKDSTGILRMLRDWKKKTHDEKQLSGLLEALNKANLKHLAGDLRPQEGAEGQREAVQTSDGDSVTSPSKAVPPTTTGSDPLTDNRKSSPSGGIPDSKLEKLAKALPGEEYRNARSLGQTLGFSLTKVNGYCGYGGKPKDSSGILRMLRDWKEKTHDEKQLSGLLEALNKANLKHLAGDLRSQEGAEGQREAVQTSDGDSVTSPSKSVLPTTTRSDPLTDSPESSPSVVPGAGPDPNKEDAPPKGSGKTDEEESNEPQTAGPSFEPTETKPKTVLPGEGPHAERATPERSEKTDTEKEREPQETDSSSKTYKTNPKTVPCNPPPNPTTPDSESKDGKEGARERKTKEVSEEEKRATENNANELKLSKEGAAAAGNGTKEDGTTNQKADNERVKEDDTNLPAEPLEHIKERPVSISVCTSAYDFNVKGLVSFLKDLMKDHAELIKEVKVHALPYNDLDHYKFPKENPVDVMLLCHSINNRRFAITDVMDALYDEYLPYCARVVGKNKMGVIVHDFEDMRETVQSSRMSSFKYKQPKAFETTSLQIICGNIENEDKVLEQMLKADREKLPEFLKNASKFPEQMKEDVNANPSLLTLSREKYHEYKAQLSSFFSSSPESNTQRKGTHDESRVDPVRAEVKDDGNRAESREISGSQTKRRFGSGSGTQPSYLKKKGKSGGFHQTPQASMDEGNLNPPWDASPMGHRRSVTSNTAAAAHNLGSPSQQPMVSGRTLTSASQRNLNPPREASPIGQQGPGTANAAAAAHSRGSPSQQPMACRKTVTSAPQISTPSPRRISVSVCSSAYEHNVQGFMSKLTKLLAAQPDMIADVRFRGLPYNDIDSFKFPSNDPVDVMVLCHSTQNRGFSITNVLNALYEKYLQYCHDVIGKKKLAVIVHDFSDCKPKTLEVRMESFRRSQPLTFELADTVIVCGSLEKPGKVEMGDEDMTRLSTFFEKARYEQRENYAVKKSFLGSFLK